MQDFTERRRQGIGGSDIAVLMGANNSKSILRLWQEKLGKVESDFVSSVPAVYWGTVLEPVVLDTFRKRTGMKVQTTERTLVNPNYKYAIAHVDGLITENDEDLENLITPEGYVNKVQQIVEIKTAGNFGMIKNGVIPEAYKLQVQWYMMVTGAPNAVIVSLVGGQDYNETHVERNDYLIENMLERAAKFWDMVENNIQPEPETQEDLKSLYSISEKDKEIEASSDILQAVNELKDIKKNKKAIELREKELQIEVQKFMAESEILIHDSDKIATWVTENRKSVDNKLLEENHGDIVKSYTTSKSVRVFRLK